MNDHAWCARVGLARFYAAMTTTAPNYAHCTTFLATLTKLHSPAVGAVTSGTSQDPPPPQFLGFAKTNEMPIVWPKPGILEKILPIRDEEEPDVMSTGAAMNQEAHGVNISPGATTDQDVTTTQGAMESGLKGGTSAIGGATEQDVSMAAADANDEQILTRAKGLQAAVWCSSSTELDEATVAAARHSDHVDWRAIMVQSVTLELERLLVDRGARTTLGPFLTWVLEHSRPQLPSYASFPAPRAATNLAEMPWTKMALRRLRGEMARSGRSLAMNTAHVIRLERRLARRRLAVAEARTEQQRLKVQIERIVVQVRALRMQMKRYAIDHDPAFAAILCGAQLRASPLEDNENSGE